MCLSDPAMAVLVGGEGVDQRSCKDALWKLEVGKQFGAVRGNGMLMGGWETRMTWVGGCPPGSVRRQVLGGFVLLESHSAGACIPYHLITLLFLFATPTLYYFSTSLLLSHSSLMSLVLGHPLVLQEAELIAQRPQRLWGSM